DGHHRILRPQGVPARRGRRRALRRRMTDSDDVSRSLSEPEPAPRSLSVPEPASRSLSERSETKRPGTPDEPEVFPPTLREVMLRPRWIGMLLLCLAVAGVFAWLGQWQLARAVQTNPVPP